MTKLYVRYRNLPASRIKVARKKAAKSGRRRPLELYHAAFTKDGSDTGRISRRSQQTRRIIEQSNTDPKAITAGQVRTKLKAGIFDQRLSI